MPPTSDATRVLATLESANDFVKMVLTTMSELTRLLAFCDREPDRSDRWTEATDRDSLEKVLASYHEAISALARVACGYIRSGRAELLQLQCFALDAADKGHALAAALRARTRTLGSMNHWVDVLAAAVSSVHGQVLGLHQRGRSYPVSLSRVATLSLEIRERRNLAASPVGVV